MLKIKKNSRVLMEELDSRTLMTSTPAGLALVVDQPYQNSFHAAWNVATDAVKFDIRVQAMDGESVRYYYDYTDVVPGGTNGAGRYQINFPESAPDTYRVRLIAYDDQGTASSPAYADVQYGWHTASLHVVNDPDSTQDLISLQTDDLGGQADYVEVQRKPLDWEGAVWDTVTTVARTTYEPSQAASKAAHNGYPEYFLIGSQQNPPGAIGYRLLSHITNSFDPTASDVSIVVSDTTVYDTAKLVMDSPSDSFSATGAGPYDYATAVFGFHVEQNNHTFAGAPYGYSYAISADDEHPEVEDAWFLYEEAYSFGSCGSVTAYVNARVPILNEEGQPNEAMPWISYFKVELYFDFGDARGVQIQDSKAAWVTFES